MSSYKHTLHTELIPPHRRQSPLSRSLSTITSVQASINRLTSEEQQLYDWPGKRLQENSTTAIEIAQSGIETRNYQGKTYVLQKRWCDRADCVCIEGEISVVGRALYWYDFQGVTTKLENRLNQGNRIDPQAALLRFKRHEIIRCLKRYGAWGIDTSLAECAQLPRHLG